MNRNKEFIKNTIILFIGKFATQFISLLLLPLFTHYLLAEDYGTVDLLQTYISLFVPVLTLRIDSAVFRFLIDKRKDEESIKEIISNIILLLIIGVISAIIICYIISNFIKIRFILYVIINLIVLMFSNVFLQILRGLGKNKEYSIASILTGIITLATNLILILVFNKGADSILISSSLANLICIIYVIFQVRIFNYIRLNKIKKSVLKEILNYSCPMIPNSLSWWIVNVSDRTIISYFLGSAFNGIYTVSCKFSNILNSVYSIFNMSWQETATLHIDDEDKDYFFTNMINELFMFFASISILLIVALPFVYDIVIGNNYLNSYSYIPILLYANLWNVLIGLIGGIYVAKKRTKEIANTTIISAVINIVINVLLIKKIGLYAACISTLFSYMIMCIYRYIDCKKYVNVKLNIKKLIIFSLIYSISSMIYSINNLWLNIINLIIVCFYLIIVNKKLIKKVINKIKNILKVVKNKKRR